MAVFPRLKADAFPHLDNATPFARSVDMDYERYDYVATIKLCTVTWDSDFANVVDWAGPQERDAWFSHLAGRTIELSSGVLRTQLDMIHVEVPYDVCLTYNYAYMKVPTLTGDDLLEHETTDGVRTVCAFIDRCEYRSPSTTTLYLTLDWWTMYLPAAQVHTLYLERGHAPMYKTTVETYLADPMNNCADLLSPDVNYGEPNIVSGATLILASNTNFIYVLASTIPYTQLASLATATSITTTPASYSDLSGRDGHQVGVGGFVWGSKDFAGASSPSTPVHDENNSLPTPLYYYGIYTKDALAGNMATVLESIPTFGESIKAIYVVPSGVITVGSYVTISQTRIYQVASKVGYTAQANTYTITKESFRYPTRYANIAKLYTAPYALLEVSTDDDNAITIAIEDTHGTLQPIYNLSIAWPFLSWTYSFSNIGANSDVENTRYTFRFLDNSTGLRTIFGNDFSRYIIEMDIPTFELYESGSTIAQLRAWADGMAQRESAIAAYQSTMRSANTGMENALDSDATAQTNANASADTAQTNANNSAANARANALVTNTERDDSRTTINTYKGSTADTSTLIGSTVQALFDNSNADLEYTMFATDANLKSEAVSSVQNMVMSAGMGNLLGAVSSGVAGVVSITTDATLASLSMQNQLDHQGIAVTRTGDQLTLAKNLDTALDVIRDTATTAAANNSATTTETNAANSRTTARANAQRTKNTGDANAGYTRGTTETNAKQALELARISYNARAQQAAIDGPVTKGYFSGTAVQEKLRFRGLHFRIKTQSPSAIARAGDAMLRYGYAYGGIWQISDDDGWCPGTHDYCYWQASDVLERASSFANNETLNAFRAMLAKGVTVWATPEKVGKAWAM